jgi:Fur family peroxide stress response transcriptional regulator
MESTKQRADRVTERMRELGFRLTPQRMAILQMLFGHHGHPTAEDLYQQVSAEFPMISLATVYKTLHVLEALGEVTTLSIDGCMHYDPSTAPHPHLICVNCERILDLPASAMPALPEPTLTETGARILRYDVRAFGWCPQCGEQDDQKEIGK